MKTYLLYQSIFVCSLIVYKSYCINMGTQSTATDNNLSRTRRNVVMKDNVEQVLKTMSTFNKYRIIARSGYYPYHAVITLKTDDSILCEGALVAPKWMLTTGSCFYRYDEFVEFVHVVSGTQNTFVRNLFISDIEYGIYHPQFHLNVDANDLALLKMITAVDDKEGLVKPIELSNTIYPVGTQCMYSTYDKKKKSTLRGSHEFEYKLFGFHLKLLDQSNCDGDPKQVIRYVCAGFDDLQFKTTDSNLEFETSNVTQIGSPLVCGNKLYGIKSKNDLFYTMYDIIPWVNAVVHKDDLQED